VLYKVIADHLETFLASLDADPDAKGLPAYMQREFYDYLPCGILAHGLLRLGCDTCKKEVLLAFSCKRRGFCPSCAGRRMAQTAAHLVERVIPGVPTRQWVVSMPIHLRYWIAASQDLTAPAVPIQAARHRRRRGTLGGVLPGWGHKRPFILPIRERGEIARPMEPITNLPEDGGDINVADIPF